jgi:cyclophilin family peptidyl-prolyl cis-trans isomerase
VKKWLSLLGLVPLLLGQSCLDNGSSGTSGDAPSPSTNPRVALYFDDQRVVIELFPVQAKAAVDAFLQYVSQGYFDNTTVHLGTGDALTVRGGLYDVGLTAKDGSFEVTDDLYSGLPNRRRYLALIVQTEEDENGVQTSTATTEFVIYAFDAPQFDYAAGSETTPERLVFGRVVEGMHVIDAITELDTATATGQDDAQIVQPIREDGNAITLTARRLDDAGNDIDSGLGGLPEITCPDAITVDADGDLTVIDDLGTATATDPEDGELTVENDAPADGFPDGTTSVIWSATDSDGNTATCAQNITVNPEFEPNPIAVIQTTLGDIGIELFPLDAPITVENFRKYLNDGFYQGLTFHRVAQDPAVIQAGGFRPDGTQVDPTYDPIVNESDNGLSNVRGTIAMARTNDPDSATSQFYINWADNAFLDYSDGTPGYAVFGLVSFGLDVVDAISQVAVDGEEPVDPVIINDAFEAEIVTTDSGLQYQDVVVGDGASPTREDTVVVNYTGTLINGTKFDSGEDASFALSGVIEGFAEGIEGMNAGGKRRLTIPPELGYGDNPPGDTIPPGAILIFDVELLEIQ